MADRDPTPGASTPPTSSGEPPTQAIVMYTTTWCPDCLRAKHIFTQLAVPFTEVNIGQVPDAAEYVMRLNRGYRSVPTIVFPDGAILTEPSRATLEAKLRSL